MCELYCAVLNMRMWFCTWRGHSEQHSGGPHASICVESTAVETTIFLCHTCQVQTDIQAICAVDPAPVTVVLTYQPPFHFLTHSNDVPGMAMHHPLQNDLVNCTIVLVVTAEGQVAVLLCYQLCVCLNHLWCGGLCAIFVFFLWWLICEYRK